MPTVKSTTKIDPGKPGLYECHYIYTLGKERFLRYIVVMQTAINFTKAYNMGILQLELLHPYTKPEQIKVKDNLINLITDPEAYISQS